MEFKVKKPLYGPVYPGMVRIIVCGLDGKRIMLDAKASDVFENSDSIVANFKEADSIDIDVGKITKITTI